MRNLFLGLAILLGPCSLHAKTYQAVRGESTLTYVLVHPMHVIHGTNNNFFCEVDLPEDPPQDLSLIRIRASADIAGFNTGNSNRDSHAMEVVDAIKYPKVEFSGAAMAKEGAGYRVTGKLRFHGKEKDISFIMTPKDEGNKVTVTGAMTVLLSDYEVSRPSLLLVPVKNEMQIEIKAVAYREKPQDPK
jgi:polyisoprenoid-binding protein YceI